MDIASQCRQPLRVMVAGDVSAGKSTLINALLGQMKAEVGRAETTSDVTWYRHPDLAGERLPSGRHRSVELAFPLASRVILVDSPGLNTTSGVQKSTLRLLSGADDEAGATSALVYLVISELSGEGDRQITDFASLSSGSIGNIVLIAGKAETVNEPAEDTERRLRSKRVGVRTVAVSQQLAMIARCGALTTLHVDIVRDIVDDAELRRFAAKGWDQLDYAWARRGLSLDLLTPLRELIPNLSWLVAVLPPTAVGLDVAQLSACCEQASRLRRLEDILVELSEDADLLTVSAATERLRRWAARRGQQRGAIVRKILDALWKQHVFAGIPQRRAALILRTSVMDHIPEPDRARAISLLRDQSLDETGISWADLAQQWQLWANSKMYGVQAGDVAQIVATTASRYWSRSRGKQCLNFS